MEPPIVWATIWVQCTFVLLDSIPAHILAIHTHILAIRTLVLAIYTHILAIRKHT